MLSRLSPVLLAATAAGSLFSLAAALREPLELGSLPLLFPTLESLASVQNVAVTVHAARTESAAVLRADRPWEGDRVYAFGTILGDPRDGFRMWYRAESPPTLTPGTSAPRGSSLVLYATSPDGLQWGKPALGRYAIAGSSANNAVYDLNSPSVLQDDQAAPSERFKLLGYWDHAYLGAVSADGIHWNPLPGGPLFPGDDTVTLSRDPRSHDFIAYYKRQISVRGFVRRSVCLARSPDFRHWTDEGVVMTADAADDDWARQPLQRTEIYNLSVYAHAGGLLGFPALFRILEERPREQMKPQQNRDNGPLDIELAASSDGKKWERVSRAPIIPRGRPGTFDGGLILGVANAPINVGQESWVYYTGMNTRHGATIPPKRSAIGLARWRLNGFASLDSGPEGGSFVTVPLHLSGRSLVVNANATHGQLRISLNGADGHPLPGFGFSDCDPLVDDRIHWTVTWHGSSELPDTAAVRIGASLVNTEVYSLETAHSADSSPRH